MVHDMRKIIKKYIYHNIQVIFFILEETGSEGRLSDVSEHENKIIQRQSSRNYLGKRPMQRKK